MTVFILLVCMFLVSWSEHTVCESCGGHVNGTEGMIISPADLDANVTCVWYLVRNASRYSIINLDQLTLKGNQASLEIYSGNNTDGTKGAEIVANFTQTSELREIIIGDNVTTIVLFTGNWAVENQTAAFKLKYATKSKCSQNLTVWSVKISSPLYSESSLPLTCSYAISGESSGRNLTVSFSKFSIQSGKVTLKNQNNTLAVLSGTSIPEDVFVKGENLDITFNTNSTKTEEFSLVINSIYPDCLQNLTITDFGIPVMLPLPDAARFPLTCQWVITSPVDSTVQASLTSDNKMPISVVVSDGQSLFGADRTGYLGSLQIGSSFVSSGNSLSVYVSLDQVFLTGNLRLSVAAQKYGGVFHNNGSIEGRGVNFDGSSTWYYLLSVEQEQKVRFEITNSSLYPASTIRCYDGTSDSNTLINEFRSDQVFFPVVSSGPYMLVEASNLELRGYFTADFSGHTQVCDSVSQGLQGHYQGQVTAERSEVKVCNWIIKPSQSLGNFWLRVSMRGFQLSDNLTVYDGQSEFNTNILLASGENSSDSVNDLPVIVIPAQNGARLMFSVEDDNKTSQIVRSVEADYTYSSTEICGGNLEEESRGQILSPLYPNERYPLNLLCVWNTTVTDGKVLYLSFETFQINPKHSLTIGQSVNQSDTSEIETLITMNGTVATANDLLLNGPYVNITFNTTELHQGGNSGMGFNISYRTIDNGGKLTSRKGSFSTPNFPKSVLADMEAIWIIDLPARKDNSSSVQIVQFDLELSNFSNLSRNNILQFRDGASHGAPLSSLKLTNGKASGLFSRTNQLWVRYMYKSYLENQNAPGFPFRIHYTTYDCPVSQQCTNGVCMQSSWKCNGIDECGDDSDEKNCSNTVTTTTGVAAFVTAILVILGIALGAIGACLLPACYKRIRYPNYRHLGDFISPIDT